MELKDLYGVVLMLVLIGVIIAVGIILLDNLSSSTGVTPAAGSAVNSTRAAIATIATTWLPLIVTIVVLGLIIMIVVRSFGGGMGGSR